MSDMSVPPLTLVPLEGEPQARPSVPEPERPRVAPYAWPTPGGDAYPPPTCATSPEPCEIEGLNGHLTKGYLHDFQPEQRRLQVQIPPARTPVALKFAQFRRLRLIRTLAPLPGRDTAVGPLRPTQPFRVELHGGAVQEGLTIGHHEDACGLFVFEPAALGGEVKRLFYPRSAYARAVVGSAPAEAAAAPAPASAAASTPSPAPAAAPVSPAPAPAPATVPAATSAPAAAVEPPDAGAATRRQQVGDILSTRQITNADELLLAIEQQSRMPMVRIGEALVALGLIDDTQLQAALEQQREDRGVPLGEILVRRGVITRQDLQTALARKMGYPLVDALHFPVETDAVARLPYSVARRLVALPLMVRGGRLVVAVEDPTRSQALVEIEFGSQSKLVPVLARPGTLAAAIDRAYEKLGAEVFVTRPLGLDPGSPVEFEPADASKLLASLEQHQHDDRGGSGDDDAPIEQSDNSLVRLINTMILEAQGTGVSDIHIECAPGREKVRIRFRKDGQLRPYLELPHTYRNALIARLKIMCDLDISERRKPQDGKIAFGRFVQGQRLELRLATIPTHGGLEDAVLRLLSSHKPIALDQLGLSPDNLQRFKQAIARPHGILLCVGPTGSGKTTTLHSALGYINTPERKIWTAEDPIEITQAGLRQVQVNAKIDWTFAKALRAFLRADPDVIMVGEIRDQETAQVAIEASLTGHLVLSTLHTNSAPETVTRLLDMGMDPFNFADALLGVLAQRLVRRVCTHCRESHEAGDDELHELAADWLHALHEVEDRPSPESVIDGWRTRFGQDGRITLYRPVGCPHCDQSGWRGRAGIHELMMVSPLLRRHIQTGARAEELARQALGEGMRTLRQDGIEKVLAGLTTLDEVRASSA